MSAAKPLTCDQRRERYGRHLTPRQRRRYRRKHNRNHAVNLMGRIILPRGTE